MFGVSHRFLTRLIISMYCVWYLILLISQSMHSSVCTTFYAFQILVSNVSCYNFASQNEISKLVTAMGGMLHMKASLDVSFVIVKSVLAAKYKVLKFYLLH